MPLHRRPSGNVGRGTPQGDPSTYQPASPSAARDSPPRTTSARPASVYDTSERLAAAQAEIQRLTNERDSFRAVYDSTNKKLSDSNHQLSDLKTQTQTFREENQSLREMCKKLQREKDASEFAAVDWQRQHIELKARFENLTMRYNAKGTAAPDNPMAGPLPDRPKPSRSSSKRESRDQRDDRDRDRERDRERDRGRGRDREREKREQHKEQKEQRAEKDRLSKRFDERRPPTSNRRNSFIEGWGPGGRSSSANPSGRAFKNVGTGRIQGQQATYANVPRTNLMSPGLYSSSGSGSSAAPYDEETFEDGNYHPYPIAR